MSVNISMPNLATAQKNFAQNTASYARDAAQAGQLSTTEAKSLLQEGAALGKQVFNAAKDGSVTGREQAQILRSQVSLAKDVFVASK